LGCQACLNGGGAGTMLCASESVDAESESDDSFGCGCDAGGGVCCCAVAPARPGPDRVPTPAVPPSGERFDQTFFAFPLVAGLVPEPPRIAAERPATLALRICAGASTELEVLCRWQT
jgi:hypothetical protein